jgi:primosomal protein N' (replication factor Y)
LPDTFVNVILPLALPRIYTYAIPLEFRGVVRPGLRVEVPLKNKLYAGIVSATFSSPEPGYKTRPIVSVLDKEPLLGEIQLKLWEWMATYYCCSLGEVMNVAMPAGLKLESETRVVFNGDPANIPMDLSDEEYMLAEAVSIRNELSILEIQDILNKKTVFPVIRSLLDQHIISIKEVLQEKFKPRMASFVTLNEPFASEPDGWTKVFDLVSKSDKQTRFLLAFAQLSRNQQKTIPTSEIYALTDLDSTVIPPLVKKGIVTLEKKSVSRLGAFDNELQAENTLPLSAVQTEATEKIRAFCDQQIPVLLHGVTGSGKTRIYSEIIQETCDSGKQTLYLLPEIALTTHMVGRLKVLLGKDVLIYHSRLSNNERVEIWNAVLGGAKIVIAARSGLFLPFQNLGLIVVDEEHDPSYKQNDPSPRYNARDGAIILSKLAGASIILGSATPSMETYANAVSGKFGLVSLADRHGASVLPEVSLVDLRQSFRDQRFNGIFSQQLLDAISVVLEDKKQVLLFQNRRGYAPTVHCPMCGWKADCSNCDVYLTLHKASQELRCHYCGGRHKKPRECPACGNTELSEQGFGTEKIEEEIAVCFPQAKVARLDLDTAGSKASFENIIQAFENREIDILVGTQMITKGLDFDHIALVGVLNADTILRYPDLRAGERAFQLLTQVAGRAGRRDVKGKVIIQTFQPDHPVINETVQHLYQHFFKRESAERKMFRYPPYFRLIQIELLHRNAETCAHAAGVLADQLRKHAGNRILGPAVPSIARIRGMYIQHITVKMEKDPAVNQKIKQMILSERDFLKTIPATKNVRVIIDVDPY